LNWYDVPLGSVRFVYNDETNSASLYLHTYDPDPAKEWNFKSEWLLDGPMAGPDRPTLGHLQTLLDMAKRKLND
jgi:hypothetical protein